MSRRAAGLVIYRLNQLTQPAVTGSDIQYLLMQTSYGEHHWTPPKGHLDPGEDDMTAALRETEEEAGYKKEQLRIHDDCSEELRYEAFGKPKIVTYWLAQLINPADPVIMSSEHQDFKWLPIEEACQLSGFKDMENTLRKFHLYLTSK